MAGSLTYIALVLSLLSWITVTILFIKSDEVASKVYAGIVFFINLIIFTWMVFTIYRIYYPYDEINERFEEALDRKQQNEDRIEKLKREGKERRAILRRRQAPDDALERALGIP